MEDLLKQFGIQPVLLIAQIINFGILVFVLTKFLYKPIIRAIDARRSKIAHSLKQAEEIEKKRSEIQVQIERDLADARSQAEDIIAQAKKGADSKRNELLAQASREAESIVAKAKIQQEREREQMEAEIENRVGDLAVIVARKVISHLDQKTIESHLQSAVAEATRETK